MFIDLNCLLHNTDIADDIKELVNDIADILVSNEQVPTVTDIYSELRRSGIEIDLSSVGHFYVNEISSRGSEFQQIDEVEQETGRTFGRTINRILTSGKPHNQIGENSPVQAVAKKIGELFRQLNTPSSKGTMSEQKELQDLLARGMKRLLPTDFEEIGIAKPTKPNLSGYELASAALDNASKGFDDLSGGINGLKQMHDALKDELQKYVSELSNVSNFDIAKYEYFIDEVISSSYQLMLSKTEAKKIVIDGLKTYQNGEFIKRTQRKQPDGSVKLNESLDWNKITGHVKSAKDLQDIIEIAFTEQGYSSYDVGMIKTSLTKEFQNIFANNIEARAVKVLQNKTVINAPNVKQNYQRLAEFYSLGGFSDKAYNEALMKTIGVEGLEKDSINKIEAIARKMQIVLDNVNDPSQAQILFRELTSEINKVITDKTYNGLKVLFHFKLFTQASLQGILGNMFNLAQNMTSGVNESLSVLTQLSTVDKRYLTKNFKSFWNTFIDVGFRNGIVEGLQTGEFANESRLDDYLRKSFKELLTNKSVGDKIIAFYKITLAPFRIFGTTFDSALKAVNQNNLIIMTLNTVLKNNGMKDPDERYHKINDILYGQSYENSIEDAKMLMKQAGIPFNDNKLKRVANDMVRYKLVTEGLITKEELQAVVASSYSVAGKGLGHEYQGNLKTMPLSSALSVKGRAADTFNSKFFQEPKTTALRENNRSAYIALDISQAIYIGLISKFTGGGARWLPLILQNAGLGMLDVKGMNTPLVGDKYNTNKNKLPESKRDMESYLNMKYTHNTNFFRGVTGLALSGALLGIIAMIHPGDDDDEETGVMEDFANKYKNSYIGDRYAKRLLPPLLQMMYSYRSTNKEFGFDQKQWDYIRVLFNIDSKYDTDKKFWQVMYDIGIKPDSDFKFAGTPNEEKGWGELGKMMGEPFSSQFASYVKGWQIATEGKPVFSRPTNFWYGMFSGGVLENTGMLESLGVTNDGVTQIPGVSGGKASQLKQAKQYSGPNDETGTDVQIGNIQELMDKVKTKNQLRYLKTPYQREGKTYYRKIFSDKKETGKEKSELDNVWDYIESKK